MNATLRRRLRFAISVSDTAEHLLARTGADALERRARRYVAGRTLDDALEVSRRLSAAGFEVALDCFGEQVAQREAAVAAAEAYRAAGARLSELPGPADLAVDLSHVGLDVDAALCDAQLERIATALPSGRRVQIGAEDTGRTDRILAATARAARAGLPVEVTLQANLRRTGRDWPGLAELGVPIRLVKGAYVESAADAVPYGEPTDLAYLSLCGALHEGGAAFSLATHDPVLRQAVLAAFGPRRVEMLLGVRPEDASRLVAEGVGTRIYVPYGDRWLRYWLRRLAEAEGS